MSIEHNPINPAAAALLDRLPPSNYRVNYQPQYPEGSGLSSAVHELLRTQPVTAFERVDALQDDLTGLATGETNEPLVVTERCAEPVNASIPIDTMASWAITGQATVRMALRGNPLHLQRIAGQAFKPRSNETEALPDGREVSPYMGDGINGQDPDDRTPDPSRMVATVLQGRDLVDRIAELTGEYPRTAHEGLLLPYEHGLTRINPANGKAYGLSGDMIWGGVRTNGATGPHVELLASLANPVAVKVGSNTTPEDIHALATTLNPERVPGRLTFMLRTGPGHEQTLLKLAKTIAEAAPQSLAVYDIHGVTRQAPTGEKIRCVPEIEQDIITTAAVLGEAGLTLHGVHLETTPDHNRLECVDEPDQLPTHPGGVDPQLNPRQLYRVLQNVRPYLLQRA